MRTSCLCLLLLLPGCGSAVEEISVTESKVAAEAVVYQPAPGDWPWWRGPDRNGVATGPAPLSWGPTENVLWKTPVPGRGHASPAVVGDLVLLSTAEEADERQLMVAFDRTTGTPAWRVVLHEGGFPPASQVHQKGTDANGTIACDGERAFIAHLNDGSIIASAVDFAGEIVWQTKLGAFSSKFGYAPSPLVYGPYVIFAADNWGGGYLAAVDRATGKIAWRKKRSTVSTYSSPVVANVAGKEQLLISGDDQLSSYAPLTGELLWSSRGASEATCGTMVWAGDTVYASGGHPGRQTLAVRADGSGEQLWTNRVKVYEPSLLVAGDELYGTTDRGIVYCWDRATGEEHWRERVGDSFSASPVLCDGRIYALNNSGETLVFAATPDGYQQLALNRTGDDAYASPAIVDGQVFLRTGTWEGDTRQEFLYCIGEPNTAADDTD